MAQGGIGLLARTADDAEDPQTLRMVAGAIANLCGNGNLGSLSKRSFYPFFFFLFFWVSPRSIGELVLSV
jgi:hypothetical protein